MHSIDRYISSQTFAITNAVRYPTFLLYDVKLEMPLVPMWTMHLLSHRWPATTIFRNDLYSKKIYRYFVEYSDKEATKKTRLESHQHTSTGEAVAMENNGSRISQAHQFQYVFQVFVSFIHMWPISILMNKPPLKLTWTCICMVYACMHALKLGRWWS